VTANSLIAKLLSTGATLQTIPWTSERENRALAKLSTGAMLQTIPMDRRARIEILLTTCQIVNRRYATNYTDGPQSENRDFTDGLQRIEYSDCLRKWSVVVLPHPEN
jgi:hypothetical protein